MAFQLDKDKDALFLDIDGTLLDIAPEADAVCVPVDLKDALAALSERMGGALALVSGRTIDNIDELFAPLLLPAAGTHGAEWRLRGEEAPCFTDPLDEACRRAVQEAFRAWPELDAHDKIRSVAVHYRQAPEKAAFVEAVLKKIAEEQNLSLRLIQGRKVVEIIKAGIDKGTAVERFMKTPFFAGRTPLFIGDDVTDLDGMAACVRLGGRGARVGRGQKDEMYAFACPAEVRGWIRKQAGTA